jgi:hypothetical protein
LDFSDLRIRRSPHQKSRIRVKPSISLAILSI